MAYDSNLDEHLRAIEKNRKLVVRYAAKLPPDPPRTPEKQKHIWLLTTIAVCALIVIASVVYIMTIEPQEPFMIADKSDVITEDKSDAKYINKEESSRYAQTVDEMPKIRQLSTHMENAEFGHSAYDKATVEYEDKLYKEEHNIAPTHHVEVAQMEDFENYRKPATMYCELFRTEQAAQELKAKLAFEGLQATVVMQKTAYKLRLGPFKNRDEAKAKFDEMSQKKLLTSCSLIIY